MLMCYTPCAAARNHIGGVGPSGCEV